MNRKKTPTTNRDRVDQKSLAAALSITPRRVRQLIDERVLPGPDAGGRYSVDECTDRFDMYRNGTERDWDGFMGRVEAAARNVDRLTAKAMADKATPDDLVAAMEATAALHSDLRFLTACRVASADEREFTFGVWDQQEAVAVGSILGRAIEMGGVMPQEG